MLMITSDPGNNISGLVMNFEIDKTLPANRLVNIYPNPINPSTMISFYLTEESLVDNDQIGQLKNNLEVTRLSGSEEELVTVLESILMSHLQAREILKTIPYDEELVTIFRKSSKRNKLAQILDFLGRVYMIKPDYNKSLEYIQTALELSRELDDNKEESYCLMNLATAKGKMRK